MHLHHLTITTGHSRRSCSAGVSAATRAHLRPILLAALSGERPTLLPGYWLTATGQGRRASVWTIHGEGGPLVTMLVCRRGKCATLWQMIGGTGRQPQHPYCAVRLEPTFAADPDAALWLCDAERSIAWTWIEDLKSSAE